MVPSVTYAGFLPRLVAVMIDSLILLPVGFLLLGHFSPFYEALFSLIIAGTYYTLFLSGPWSATPGKRLMGVYIVTENGTALSRKQALERYLAYILPSLPLYSSFDDGISQHLMLFLSMVWFLPILLTPERTGLHDRLCGTRAVKGKR